MDENRHKSFRTIWGELPPRAKNALAEACEVNYDYLRRLAGGHRNPSRALATLIAAKLGGGVVREALFPEVFTEARLKSRRLKPLYELEP